jgi:two-component system, NarL family, sensor kinase
MTDTSSDSERLRRRNGELEILNRIAEALNRPVELEQSIRIALGLVAELLGLQTGWIFLLDESTGVPYLAASQNLPPGLAEDPGSMTGSCYCLDTYRAGDMAGAANVNVVTCTRLKWLADGSNDGLRYHASIPLYASGEKLGVLNVASTDWRELSAEDLRLLYTVGDLLGLAIARGRLFAASTRLGALEERNRIAREIHDTLAQGLTAVTLKLEMTDALLDAGNVDLTRLRGNVRAALDLVRANLDEARRSVLDLRAAPLEGRRLDDALQLLCDRTSREHGIHLNCSIDGDARLLSSRVDLGLYRIAQEAIANAVNHGHARTIDLSLTIGAENITLTIDDDGDGFDHTAPVAERHGLTGMNERARLLGGALVMQSAPDEGTHIEVTIPTDC